MEVAFGVIGWSAQQFWRSTPLELRAALRGWQRAQGVDPEGESPESNPKLLSKARVAEMKRFMDSMPDRFVREE